MSLTGHRRWCRSSWWPDHLRNWGTSWSEKVSNMELRKTHYDARRRDKLFVHCHGITFTSLAFPLPVTVSLIFARGCPRYMDWGHWMLYHQCNTVQWYLAQNNHNLAHLPLSFLWKKSMYLKHFKLWNPESRLSWFEPNQIQLLMCKRKEGGSLKMLSKKGRVWK